MELHFHFDSIWQFDIFEKIKNSAAETSADVARLGIAAQFGF